MSAPLAYFITWTTYGTWLPGDRRGWVKLDSIAIELPDAQREAKARSLMREEAVWLNEAQRSIVASTIRVHCQLRGWQLHALNVRTNHVHLVATAEALPETVMSQCKAWCSRRLNEESNGAGRQRWWTQYGSTRYVKDEVGLAAVIEYVLHGQ